MVRTIEKLDGLAALGAATVGPITLRIPELIESRPSRPEGAGNPRPPALTLTDRGTGGPGHRALRLDDGQHALLLDIPASAPELSGSEGLAVVAGGGTWAMRWPPSERQWDELRTAAPEAVLLVNARGLFSEGEPFVRAVGELRERLGGAPLIWAPRTALPHRLPMLAYLGVDLVDTTEALWRSAEGVFLDAALGSLDPACVRTERACPCPACTSGIAIELGEHAESALRGELARVRVAIREGRLRELVEARLTAEPLLGEILRHADRLLDGLLEERSPVIAGGSHTYVIRESHRRPEVRRFRARFLERYDPPPSKRVLLLVPCSKTKPYRSSRSHRRLAQALDGLPNLPLLHTVSVTSPLGLVPRELEDTPPARQYDIPVTGEWDEGEREAVLTALAHLLSSGRYRSVVVHLDPAEYSFLAPGLSSTVPVEWTMSDARTTSSEALAALRRAAEQALGTLEPLEGGPMRVVREELEVIASVQFGPEAGHRLFQPPVRLQGRPWFQRVTDGSGIDLATWRDDRGLFQLTTAGGERMLPAHPLEVEVGEGVPLTGDLFVPGIARADPRIRVGDAVLLVRDGSLVAVGEAAVPGRLMKHLRRGLGVRIRHRVREPAHAARPTAT